MTESFSPPAPSSVSLLSAMEEIAAENELIHCLSWKEIQITLRSAAQCIREQQAALEEIKGRAQFGVSYQLGEDVAETASVTLAKWRIE